MPALNLPLNPIAAPAVRRVLPPLPQGAAADGLTPVQRRLMVEYALNEGVALKLNVTNVSNELYADSLYTGHCIPGAARAYQLTLTARF
jgi:hypothetical protein